MIKKLQVVFLVGMFSFINTLFGQQNVNYNYQKAERILKKLVRKNKVPGIAITVAKKGKTVLSKGYGFADIKNKVMISPSETIFRVGSVSKPIAATGLAKMVSNGDLDLNNSIYKCVPDFPKKKYDFTLKQIGGHLAGIRNYKENEFMNNKPLSIKEGVALFKDGELLFEPGTGYAYTSYSWNLLSLAMQEVAKKPFEEIINKEVLEPLQLKNTFPDKQEGIFNKAIFYQKKSKRKFVETSPVNNYFKLAGGGYLSTSEDITKLGNAYLSNDFLSEVIKKQFITSQKIGNHLTYYGVGWQTSYDHKGRPYFGHIGNGLGGYGIFYVYPESEIVITILMNCSNPNQNKKFNKIIDAVLKGIGQFSKQTF